MKTDAIPMTGTSSTGLPGTLTHPLLRLIVSQAQSRVVEGESTSVQNVIPPSTKRGDWSSRCPHAIYASRSRGIPHSRHQRVAYERNIPTKFCCPKRFKLIGYSFPQLQHHFDESRFSLVFCSRVCVFSSHLKSRKNIN